MLSAILSFQHSKALEQTSKTDRRKSWQLNLHLHCRCSTDKQLNYSVDAIYIGEAYDRNSSASVTDWEGAMYKIRIPWIGDAQNYGDLSSGSYVFLQSYGPASAYVGERGPQGFTVRVPDGQDDVAFSYRLVAKRAGYAHARLESAFSTGDEPSAVQPPAQIKGTYRLNLPLLTVQ